MNISEKYSKQQLDRSAYISEDKYKKAFDLNRIRLAVYKVTGSSSRFSYYYTEYLFFYLLERLHALGITTTFNRGLFDYIDSMEVISKDDDEEQLKTAEADWGTEVIDRIIDEVTGDDDLGDYEDPPEDEARKAAEEAASDDSGGGGEFKLPWEIDKPGAPTPPSVITETAKGTLEETAKSPDAPNTPKGDTDVYSMTKEGEKGAVISVTNPKGEEVANVPVGRGTGEGDTVNIWYDPDSGDVVVVVTHPGEDTANPDDMKAAAEEGRTTTLPLGPDVTTTEKDGTVTYTNPEGWEVTLTCVTTCDTYAACGGDSSNTPACDTPGCDTPTCDEPTCDCDCDCDCDCCDADCDCVCDCCVNDCDCDCDTPCDCDCSEDSSCSSDCNDCCIGDGGCSSDAGCACDCCVSDCDCCISDACDCDTWCDYNCDSWDE